MKYHVATFGCQMNEADSQRLASELEKLGLRATDNRAEADVLVLNTCVVRQGAEDKALSYLNMIKPLKQRNPNVVVGVMGCLVGVRGNTPLKRAFPWVDVFMAPSDPAPMVDFLLQREGKRLADEETQARFALQDNAAPELRFRLPAHEVGKRVSVNVPVVYGCSHACTFCIIPFRRGVERSRPLGEIVAEVRDLVAQGVKEVTLLGQIVDRYGYDLLGEDYAIKRYNPGAASGIPSQNIPIHTPLVDLLQAVNDIEGLERVRFLTSHPNWMTDELLDAVRALPKVMPHIEVPVQAGDDEVLLRMRRGYTSDDYRRLVERIRAKIPNVAIATDIIVGFCGETEAQFMRTYELLEELRLDVVHLAKYSPRPHTLAAREYADDVPEAEKERRFRLLEAQHERITREINQQYLDRTVEVLVEGKHKGKWRGRTPQNKLVFFEDESRNWLGQLAQVKITWAGAWSLQGTVQAQPQETERERALVASA
ncbi:MAG: MiaB/RimO family radical SAM methylthiotransferase [Anaerolineae bacterium]|nr:MiaB/RimO family radical SAM methylthiotransferase [Thermoflexales bacterium]MDW8396153.1 MiaB/RimO family radical SAM methylthiotransferase [Anaerolineae bacterium]